MIYSLARAALTVGIGWAIFRSLKRIFGKNPLDNLPGPPGGSFLAGTFLRTRWFPSTHVWLSSGHLDKVFNDYAWDYHKHISKTRMSSLIPHSSTSVVDEPRRWKRYQTARSFRCKGPVRLRSEGSASHHSKGPAHFRRDSGLFHVRYLAPTPRIRNSYGLARSQRYGYDFWERPLRNHRRSAP